jgi:hypothetical protein
MKSACLVLLLVISFSVYSQDQPAYTRAKVMTGDTGIVALQKLGIVVDDGVIKKGEYIIRDFSAAEMQKIQSHGFVYEVVITDVQQHYIDRNKTEKKKGDAASDEIRSDFCGGGGYAVPQYFTLGSMGGFYTLDEINLQLDSIRMRFPALASVKMPASSTLTTYEGRVPYLIRLSNNPDVLQTKPRILYKALTHAREPAGMQQLFYFMYYLLENYQTDNTCKYILDNCEIYVIPCVNPDGYRYNETTDPNGGGMHRKNVTPNGTSNPGVDLNRNYGYEWGYDDVGSSPDPSTDVYRGTAGFSEAETQIMRDFYLQYQFDMSIDYHCYSNLLIYPWSYYDGETPDSLLFRAYAALMTAANGYASGNPTQTVGYTANGCSVDWFYGEQTAKPKVLSFAPEAGDQNDGFWPQVSRIQEICAVNLEANLLLALFATHYGDISDVSDIFTSANDYAVFKIKGLGKELPADLIVSLVPVSGIASAGSSIQLSNLQILETRTDSVSFTVETGLAQGSYVRYFFRVQTPSGTYDSDTIIRIYGQPPVIFEDDFTAISNWTTSTWGITTQTSCSGNSAMTDTPTGNYGDNATRIVTKTQALDLTHADFAAMSFCAKWDICPGYDYLELAASADNGVTWTDLCGKYSKPLAHNNNRYSYEGTQTNWVNEWIPLDDYLGQSIKIRFKLRSGYAVWIANDGFYVDNLKVYANDTTTHYNEMADEIKMQISPNPARENLYIHSKQLPADFRYVISLPDGRMVVNGKTESHVIYVGDLPQGMYLLTVSCQQGMLREWFIKE